MEGGLHDGCVCVPECRLLSQRRSVLPPARRRGAHPPSPAGPRRMLETRYPDPQDGRRWLVCFAGDDGVEPPPLRTGKAVGVDKGLRALLACSDGTRIDNPRWLRTSLARIRRAQRALARKAKGGSNCCKQAQRVARLYEKVANQRKDFWHKITKKPSENSGFHPFCKEKSPDSSTSHPMKNARRTDRLDDP